MRTCWVTCLDAFVDLLNRCADAPSSVLDASVKDVASSLPPQPTHLKTKLHAAAEAGELSTLSTVQPKAMVLPATSTAAAAGDLKVPVQLNCFSSFLENGDGTSSSAGAGTWPALISAAFALCVSQFCTSDDACVLTLGPHGPENFFVSQHVKSSTMFQQVYADACHAHAVGSARSNSVGVDAQLTGANVCFSCTPGVSFPDSCAVALSVTINENSSSSGACGWIQSPIGSVPREVLTGIAQSLQSLLPALCETGAPESTWLRPLCDLVATPGPVATTRPDSTVPIDLLHEPFLAIASKSTPPSSRSAPAVMSVSESGEMVEVTYSELQTACDNAATALVEHVSMAKSSSEGTCVIAVVMEKGWEQVVAVLATHRLQCAYLPMDARLWPEQRIRQVLRLSGALAVFTQPHLLHDGGSLGWMTELDIPVVSIDAWMMTARVDAAALSEVANIPRVTPDDLAYLIYTSGSTGVPKGVCCHHQGAMNTIDDLNSLFEVGSNDRVLALSSLSFDLSVYDIFGLLSAGGTVVIPNHSCVSPPDPSEWFDLVVSQQVTIWDTVPAFMELLVSHAEFTGSKLPRCLRLIYMSGDWIPVTLPNRIRAVSDNPDIRIISMGGATEAAIWSNMFELGKEGSGIPDAWASVPYGRPMRNQRMYILNERMEHCAEWVTGSIYIGGAGVAKGYYKNPERTAYQFVKHPMTGEALFRTGDLGRVRPGGLLEILGREDSQVKVNGFRIELGEIERVLAHHEDVASAALAVHSNMLCAYLVLHRPISPGDVEAEAAICTILREACRVKLTDYMVPKHFMLLDEIPLSPNGKVMREKLPPIAPSHPSAGQQGSADSNSSGNSDDSASGGESNSAACSEKEHLLISILSAVLGIASEAIGLDTNVFSLGCDSLRSVQVVAQAKKNGLLVSVPQVFNNPTVRALAAVANSFRELGPEVLGVSSDQVSSKPIFTVEERPDLLHEEYPLIGINQAHFVGLHTSSYARGGMTPQIYFEWEITTGHVSPEAVDHSTVASRQLDVASFEQAIDHFVARHPTFRAVVQRNGTMKVLEHVPRFKIAHVNDWQLGVSTKEHAEELAQQFRSTMMDNGPTVHDWPLFEVRVTHTSATSSLVHINISLFLMDAMSDLILRQELSTLYRAYINRLPSNTATCSTSISSMVDDGSQQQDHQRQQLLEVLPELRELPAPSRLLFKDYCAALTTRLQESEEYQRARDYWMARLDSLSSGPELPMLPASAAAGALQTGKFVNQHRWLSALEWKRAKKNCAHHSVTVPAMLLAAYSLVLYRWGSRDHFLINILQCLRHQVHEDVNKMFGNCSSTILCDIDLRRPADGSPLTFRLAVQRVAQELSRNLEHASMSGVEVMQELNRLRGNTFKAVAPFIFTTPIGVEKGNKQVSSRNWMFQERFFSERVPHTACVNAIKADPSGSACASLDTVDGLFPPEVVHGMHATYCALLDVICAKDPNAWHDPIEVHVPLPNPVPSIRPDAPVPTLLMHEAFQKSTAAIAATAETGIGGNRTAVSSVLASGQLVSWSYADMDTASSNAAASLVTHIRSSDNSQVDDEEVCSIARVIAVVMEKGWEQVVAVLATHRLQCAYLPMDARLWPEQRIRQVLRLSGALAVFTQPHLLHDGGSLGWMTELDIPVVSIDALMMTARVDAAALSEVANIPRVTPDDLAYLIYTSGSTGVPKGVCCHHQGAMNTIDDLNSLFEVGSNDRVLALSSLSFDLSVYDIFGLLSAGGTVVIPNHSCVSPPDPSEWFDLVVSQQVTIWNTVPAFMELLVSHAEFTGSKLPRCLRLIYMSGDWIPVTLPNRIRAVSDNPDIRIISMGGATEAAIWSNMFELGKEGSGIPDAWASVPYGRPMRNQRMYILNERMEHCAEWVTGSIYIGGAGVAKGYYKNPERTAYQFVKHPMTGEALFRTGDLGRVRPGGLLEILGREDSQVKVNGFRIELGEIERVLTQHDKVASAALAVHSNMLCAYLVLHTTDSSTGMQGAIAEATFEELREACRVKLAEYMVPKHFMLLDEIPLSSNGKVMREKLPSPIARLVTDGDGDDCQAGDGGPGQGRRVGPKDETEAAVRGIFAKVLKLPEAAICCASSTFFELGGNSLSSIQLVFAVRECFGVALGVQELFQAPTVVGVTAVLADRLPKHLADGGDDDGDDKSPSGAGAGAVAEDKATSMMKELQLHQGTKGNVPLIMFNPAGASGLW